MLKQYFIVVLILILRVAAYGQKDAVFLDNNGDTTTYEEHHAFQISGKYKSVYDKKSKTRKLIPYTKGEFEKELAKTAKKTILEAKVGERFPNFEVHDTRGKKYNREELLGKVVVINFWFIGCAPCEMERPELNEIFRTYSDNPEVVFISFAKNSAVQLEKFLAKKEFLYPVVPLDDTLIDKFELVHGYPQNQIIGKDGNYSFNSKAAGIGSGVIIKNAIEEALQK